MKQKKTIAQRVSPKVGGQLADGPPRTPKGGLAASVSADITSFEEEMVSEILDPVRKGIYPDPNQIKLPF